MIVTYYAIKKRWWTCVKSKNYHYFSINFHSNYTEFNFLTFCSVSQQFFTLFGIANICFLFFFLSVGPKKGYFLFMLGWDVSQIWVKLMALARCEVLGHAVRTLFEPPPLYFSDSFSLCCRCCCCCCCRCCYCCCRRCWYSDLLWVHHDVIL